jgi:hypothetical protein
MTLIDTARQKLWVAEAGYDEEGELTTNATGLDEALDANCRLLAKGERPVWYPFGIFETVEAAQAACDALTRARKERQAKERRENQRTPAPHREPGEDPIEPED